MPSMQLRYPFPRNWQDFESLCLRLYRKHWNVPNLQIYALSGQRQFGADLLGTDNEGRICVIQCKQRDIDRSLSEKKVRDGVESVKQFKPKVERFAIATTAKRDPRLQDLAAQITREHTEHGLFSVEVHSWDDLVEILNEHPEVADGIYPNYGAGRAIAAGEPPRQSSRCPIDLLPSTAPDATLAAGEPSDVHCEIDEAGTYLKRGDLTVAEVLLDRIQKRHGGRFTPRCWYRIHANQGHILRLRGRFREAGRLYLQAKEYQPQDPAARWIEGLAFVLTGDIPKAGALAERLVADHPSFSRGWALWVGTRPQGTPLNEIESAVPGLFRDDPEVALNLAGQAAEAEQWPDCERYARIAVRPDPNWRDAKVQLAIALIGQAQKEAIGLRRHQASDDNRPRVEEARDLLEQAIENAPNYVLEAHLALLRVNLAVAYGLLGLPEDSDKAVRAAYDMAPGEPDVRRAYAVHLLQHGDLDGAAGVLAKAIEAGRTHAIVLLMAQVLATRNHDDDQKKAIALLDLNEDTIVQLAKESPALRSDWITTLLCLRLAEHQIPDVQAILQSAPGETWLRAEEKAVFKAAYVLDARDKEGASELAELAACGLTAETHPVAIRRLAFLLRALGRFEDAASAVKRIVPLDHVDGDSDFLLDCAARANRFDLVLEYSSQLRANGCLNPKYIRNEIALLSQVSPVRAVDVLLELLRTSMDERLKRECRAVLSYLARILGKANLIETRLSEMPAVADLPDARLGRVVVEVLRHGPNSIEGVAYAYELYRRFSGVLDAHMAVVNSFNMDLGHTFDLAEPGVAGPGTAVGYQEDDTGEQHWLIIEDSDRPDVSRDEHAPSEPISAALAGRTKGQKFALREHPPRMATIVGVTSKYVFRFRQCLGNMETRFSGQSPVLEFHVPRRVDGTPDVGIFLEQLKEITGREDQALQVYRKEFVPLHMVASVQGATVFEVAQQVAYDPNTRIRCCLGDLKEKEAALQAMRTSNAFVLDATALSTLALFEAQGICRVADVLESLPCRSVVSEHVLLDLRKLQDLRFGADREQMFVGAAGGQLYRHTMSADEMREAREQLQRLLDLLRGVCLVEQGTDLARHIHGDEVWLSVLGPAGLHSMLLAAKPGRVLWTDDRVAAQIAAERFAVNRTWTQATLLWLELTGRVTKAVQQEATLVLVRAGYVFTSINHEHVLRAAEQVKWDVDSPRLAPILGQFADGSADPPARLALAAATLKAMWQRGLVASHTTVVTFRILDALASDNTGRAIVDAIHSHVDQVFGLDVINAEGLKQAITAWKASERGIIRP